MIFMRIGKNLACLISGALIVSGAGALDNQRESPQENCKELCSEVLNEKGKVSFSIGKVNYYINVYTNNNPGISASTNLNSNINSTNQWLDMSVVINPGEVKYYWFNFRDYECNGILNGFGMYFIDANSTNKVNCSGKIAQSMYEHRMRMAIGHLK